MTAGQNLAEGILRASPGAAWSLMAKQRTVRLINYYLEFLAFQVSFAANRKLAAIEECGFASRQAFSFSREKTRR